MIKGVTSLGFRYKISESVFNDFELLDLLYKTKEDGTYIIAVLDKLLGENQKKNLYNFLRNDDGIVPTEKINQTIEEIFKNAKIKNSLSSKS